MQKWILAGLLSLFFVSCASSTPIRDVASSTDPSVQGQIENDEQDLEAAFQQIMSSSAGTVREQNVERARKMAAYVREQGSIFFIAQGLINSFDSELNRLHSLYVGNSSAELDAEKLKKLQEYEVQLRVAWSFSEQKLHTLLYIYQRLLTEAQNAESEFNTAARYTLSSVDTFLNQGIKKGDPAATYALAEELQKVNIEFKAKNPGTKVTPRLKWFLNISPEKKAEAYKASIARSASVHDKNVDAALKQAWQKYSDDNTAAHAESAIDRDQRQPNSDTLYPDAGGFGNITGNRFKKGTWAITLDDGPHPTYTQGMIDAISAKGIDYKATFFWLSKGLKANPKLIAKAKAAGFRIASHSYSHANLPSLGAVALTHEIEEAADTFALPEYVGERPTFFRCPYGACNGNNSKIRQKIANRQMMHVFWNVDSLDWQDQNAESIFQRVKKQMDLLGRGIVLFHDIHPQSVEAVKLTVAYMKKNNFNVLTMDQIMKEETGNDYHSP